MSDKVDTIAGFQYDWDDGYAIADGNVSMKGFSEGDALRYVALHVFGGEDARLMFEDAQRESVREALRPLARASELYAETMDRDSCPCLPQSKYEVERDDGIFWIICEDCGEVHDYCDLNALFSE